jgi:hypothetical protein
MTPKANQCPHCGVQKDDNVTAEDLEQFKKGNWIIFCKSCGLLMKITLDEKTCKVLSFEKLSAPISLPIHSSLLNQDLFYSESPMPDSDCENLKQIIRELRQYTKLAKPESEGLETQIDKNRMRIAKDFVPQLGAIYNAYPLQVELVLQTAGLTTTLPNLLALFAIPCPKCGISIPKVKHDNCPICKNVVIQEQKTPEDPLTRRLRFLLSEREQKGAEMEQIRKQVKTTGVSGFLSGDAQTTILQMQQMNGRLNDIQGEIRKIDFEIQQLQSEIDNKGTQNTQTANEEKVFCRYCGIPNEADAVFCKKCGKKIA